jgi:hypothetical protein
MTEPVQIVERYREMHQQCKLQEFSLTQYSGASIAKLIEELSTAEQENAKLREALKEARPYLYETLDAPIDVRNKVSDALLEASK